MKRRFAATFAVAISLVLAPLIANAVQFRGLGGPETNKPPRRVYPVRPKVEAKKESPAKQQALPKGMLRPGQGPFPNLPNVAAEGKAPEQLPVNEPD